MFTITVSTISALLGGALFGLRFNVLILMPVIPIAWIGAIATCRVCVGDGWTIGIATAAATIAAQIGYLIGSDLRGQVAKTNEPYPEAS